MKLQKIIKNKKGGPLGKPGVPGHPEKIEFEKATHSKISATHS